MKITYETPVTEVLSLSPKIKEVFQQYGLECFGCHGSNQDRVRHVVQNNGLDGEAFIKDLNDSL